MLRSLVKVARSLLCVLALLAAAATCASPPAACPSCPAPVVTASSMPAPAPVGAPSASSAAGPASATSAAAAPPADAGRADDNPWCDKGSDAYGGWSPSAKEVLAAAQKLKDGCAATDWVVQSVGDCIQRLAKSNVVVMAGLMNGESATPYACQLDVSSAEWQGRRWIVFESWVRDGAAVFQYASAFEMTRKGPVQVTNACQGSPTATMGAKGHRLSPAGWSTMPDELKARLCAK